MTNNEYLLHSNIIYKKLEKFKSIPNVMNGRIFQIGRSIPKSWYEAISTTGYCVKVSQVFLEIMLKTDPYLFTKSKTISITLDSNKFGKCGDGGHNSWHTAIDSGYDYIIDLTIAQFGSKYNNRFIWKKKDWLKEFQSQNDPHVI